VAKLASAISIVRQTNSRVRTRTIMELRGLLMAHTFLEARASDSRVSLNANTTHATCTIAMPSVTRIALI
jgi:hypothetical protein